ncbi:MAG: hypothetical protein BJ554DRAFT_3496 [Olpidium bornovanus]|uniref:non-specific serine/threonine protein kinase n=1 Tax=Olpidium bornovanus TaxID=278681 RepID=A0A8H7ZP81_9FUNG|nr:MAG: hypothetical protein BJ554DRAFT_3496 [Olpidium bornovanus]
MLACIKKLGCFNLAAARFYIAEIVAVIEYMHTKQIIHRDLKPEKCVAGWLNSGCLRFREGRSLHEKRLPRLTPRGSRDLTAATIAYALEIFAS